MCIFRLRFIFGTRRFMFIVSFLSLNWSSKLIIFMDKLTKTLFKTWDNEQLLFIPIHVLNLASFKWMFLVGLSLQLATSTQKSQIILDLWPISFWQGFRMSLDMDKLIVSRSILFSVLPCLGNFPLNLFNIKQYILNNIWILNFMSFSKNIPKQII